MITVQQAYLTLSLQLQTVYNKHEAANIANLVTEHITGFGNSARLLNKRLVINSEQQHSLQQITEQLLAHKPIQYVLHEAFFLGMKLYVDEHVLIPRPETEELVEWIINNYSFQPSALRLLDIGTGSGCISIALKKALPGADVHALDVSADALEVAKQNASAQNAVIHFHKINILDDEQWKHLPQFDVIVSNPPYITRSEAVAMSSNVLEYEPHLALFTEDGEPLKFYKVISLFAKQHLKKRGKLFFEINEAFGKEVSGLLAANGFVNIELKKDMQEKDRMIKGEKPPSPKGEKRQKKNV